MTNDQMKATTQQQARQRIESPDGRKITQKEIAGVLGIPRSTADKMLRGVTRTPTHILVKLWRHYDVGPELAVHWGRILSARYIIRHPGAGGLDYEDRDAFRAYCDDYRKRGNK